MSLEKIEEREGGVHLRRWESHDNTVTITLTEAVGGPRLHAAMHAFSRTLAAPPSQPGGEAESRLQAYLQATEAEGDTDITRIYLSRAEVASLLAQRDADAWAMRDAETKLQSLLARAEASEQKATDLADETEEQRVIAQRDAAHALLRRVVGAVEPFATTGFMDGPEEDTDRTVIIQRHGDYCGPERIAKASDFAKLAAIRTEALALLPPSGDVEGEGKQGVDAGYASPSRPQMAEHGAGGAGARDDLDDRTARYVRQPGLVDWDRLHMKLLGLQFDRTPAVAAVDLPRVFLLTDTACERIMEAAEGSVPSDGALGRHGRAGVSRTKSFLPDRTGEDR